MITAKVKDHVHMHRILFVRGAFNGLFEESGFRYICNYDEKTDIVSCSFTCNDKSSNIFYNLSESDVISYDVECDEEARKFELYLTRKFFMKSSNDGICAVPEDIYFRLGSNVFHLRSDKAALINLIPRNSDYEILSGGDRWSL